MQRRHSRIAWSRSGLLAYIDGQHKVYVTWLQCKDGSEWGYVPPVHVQVASESRPVQLSWSTTNFDLAVADELGRVHVVSINASGVPTNQIIASAVRDQRPRPAELDRLVGMHWLGSEKSLIIPRSSNTESSKPWESVPPLGPFHPLKTRSALISVNGNGMLRVLVQTPDYQYSEIDALMPGAHNVTHACFNQAGGDSLLILAANGDGNLVAYEALIKWKPENLESKQDFVTVSVYPVASIPLPSTDQQLKKLVAFRPIGSDAPTNEVVVRAVLSHSVAQYRLQHSEEALHQSFFELYNASDPVPPDPYRVWRLDLEKTDPSEKEIFDYIVTRIVVVTTFTDGTVERESLAPMVDLLQFDKAGLQFPKNELLGQTTTTLSSSESSTTSASSSGTSGGATSGSATTGATTHADNQEDLTTTSQGSLEDICFSPTTSCAAAYFSHSGPTDMPALISIQVENAGTDGDGEQAQIERAKKIAATLSASYTCTVFNSEQCDDVLLVCRNVLHNPQTEKYSSLIYHTLAYETQRLLNVQLSAPEDPHKVERLVVIPSPSQRWLSFLIALGTTSNWSRTPSCYKALCLLQLQLLAFGITWTLKRISQRSRAQNVPQMRMEIQASQYHLASMLGPVRWATDLIVRISQEIYDASTAPEKAREIVEKPNVYIALLLSGVSRYLLRYFLRGIRSLSAAAKNIAEQESKLNAKISQAAQLAKDPNLAQEMRAKLSSPSNYLATRTLRKLGAQLQAVPVKIDAFEKLIVNLDEGAKALYTKSSISDEARNCIDSDLIIKGVIPKEIVPLVKPLVESAKANLFPQADVPSLYFYDTAWLGLDDVEQTEEIDGLRKRIMLPSEAKQVCTRCGMKSVTTSDQTKQASQWLLLFQRHCICGGSWLRKTDPA